jgi:hypothetical protein
LVTVCRRTVTIGFHLACENSAPELGCVHTSETSSLSQEIRTGMATKKDVTTEEVSIQHYPDTKASYSINLRNSVAGRGKEGCRSMAVKMPA